MTADEDRIEVEFSFENLPLRRLLQRVQSFHRPNRALQILVSVAWWLVLTIGFVGLLQIGKGYPVEGPEFLVIGFSAGMVVTVLVLILMNRMVVKSSVAAIRAARSRQGRVRIVLSADGLAYHGAGLSSLQSWANVDEVVVVRDVTLIMPSRAEFYPLPHANLPTGITPERLLRRIGEWRKAAEGLA